MPVPNEAMAEEAQRGLDWREEYGRGGTDVGVARARDISNRRNLSQDTVQRMVSYFARHEVDKEAEGWRPGEDGYPSAGRIAWALWGGDPGKAWAARNLEEEGRQMKQPLDYKLNMPVGFASLEGKLDGDGRNKIVGLGSTFGNIDQVGDVIERGAFQKCLKRCREMGRKIVMLDHHKMDQPVGVWERIEETEKGLECEGRLTMGVQRAKELRDLVMDGAIDGLSIGFRALDYYNDPDTGVRYLTEIDLREISLVSMPANESAKIEALKTAAPNIKTARDFEKALRETLGFSANAAKSIAAGGFKAPETRDVSEAFDTADLRDVVARLKQSLRA